MSGRRRPGPVLALALVVLAGALLFAPLAPAEARPTWALADNLVAYWKLEEASGTRLDELTGCGGGGCDLTDNNTVTQNTGKLGNAAQFTSANTEFLSIADHADLSAGNTNFTVAAWVYLDSEASTNAIIGKFGAAGNREYRLIYSGAADRFQFTVSTDGTAIVTVDANNFGAASLSTWYYVVGWHDATGDVIGISVNAGTPNTTAHSAGVVDTGNTFNIGQVGNASGHWSGRIDAAAFWRRVVSGAEITTLYNAGVGCDHPFSACEGSPPTDTPIPPTASDTPIPPTNTPTDTPIPPTATDTPIPPTFTPSDTPEGPTLTPSDTPIPPTATDTPIPPTASDTPIPPTITNTAPPTDTPTITPTPDDVTEFDLPSGRTLSFEWRWRMGELAIFGALVVLIAFIAFVWLYEQVKREI